MLSGKLALVTGAASGIGFQVAKKFAQQGATICMVDMQKDITAVLSELSQSDRHLNHSSYICDVSQSTDVNTLFKEIKAKYPEHKVPSIIVNSAGITRDNFLVKISEEDFDKVIDVNLKGTFLVTQAAAKELIANYSPQSSPKSYASIINLSSIVGKLGNAGQASYAASKAGVDGLTKSCARELGRYKIRCNTILPGFIRTPMTDHVPEKVLQRIVAMIPMQRMGDPEEIANLSLFLASDLSSYITGASIDCNGGLGF